MYRHYNPKAFYPVNPGEVFHNSYKTVVKLGFGSHSTVWLAEDLRKYIFHPLLYICVCIPFPLTALQGFARICCNEIQELRLRR